MIRPAGALLLIGDAHRETDAQRRIRSDFVHSTPKIDVASYRHTVLNARVDVGFTEISRPFMGPEA